MKIKAAVCREFSKPLAIEELELAEPRAGEVLVKVAGSGICATDIGCIKDGMGGMDKLPIVFGHEGSGIVEAVGPGVSEFSPGDHVVVSYPSCGKCRFCREGKPWFCEHGLDLIHGGAMSDGFTPLSKNGKPVHNFFGTSTFATYLVSNVNNIAKVDQEAPIELLGSLACGFMTGAGTVFNVLQPRTGDSIAVFGMGAIGMAAIMTARLMGCGKIIAVDVVDSRLELARELGATHTVNSRKTQSVPEEIMSITGTGTDCAVEASGVASCVKDAYASTRTDGTVAMVGVSHKVEFESFFFDIYGKRTVSINMGLSNPKLFIPIMVDWYKRGMFPIDRLVKYYPLDNINEAIEDSKSGAVVKPIIKF